MKFFHLFPAFSSVFFAPTTFTSAEQNIAGLLNKNIMDDEPYYSRLVVHDNKPFARKTYGAEIELHVMFQNTAGTRDITFDEDALSTNSEDFVCQNPSEPLAPPFDNDNAKVCVFTPQRFRANSAQLEYESSTEMYLFVEKADNRRVVFRHSRPLLPQCVDENAEDGTYDVLGSCTTGVNDIVSWDDGFHHKPSVADNEGTEWAPIILPGNKYVLTIKNENKRPVIVEDGIKVKATGYTNRSSSPSSVENEEEVLDAILPLSNAARCDSNSFTLNGNEEYVCKFSAIEYGFLHVPLKRNGTTGKRRVKVTLTMEK